MKYELEKIRDFLKVPSDRREECVHELLYALALHELAFGDHAKETLFGSVVWTDDGTSNVSLTYANGDSILSLEVTKDAA